MKREISMLMRDQLETMKLPEGGRRVTRSCNKGSSSKSVEEHVYRVGGEVVKNESMSTASVLEMNGELEFGIGKAESGGETALTTTPLQMELKMYRKVGLDSSSDQIAPTIVGRNAYSPAQVDAGGRQPVVRKNAQDSVKGRSRVESQGRITTKNSKMHKLVFKTEDALSDAAELHYVVQGKKVLRGSLTPNGILCSHCHEVVSASKFEAHAGYASRKRPYDNIFKSDGVSLHTLAIRINNDISTLTQNDGGDVVCCKICTRAFHAKCVRPSSIPQETGYCRHCQYMLKKAGLEELSANAIAAGRVPGHDPLKEIIQGCIRMPDIGGCAICSCNDFTKDAFGDRTVIICDQCEQEFHVGCLREKNISDLKAVPDSDWFCSEKCNRINSKLQEFVERGDQNLSAKLLSDVVKKAAEQVSDSNYKLDIKWRLLNGRRATEANRKLLCEAIYIFRNRFDAIADSTSPDLIPHMVNGERSDGQYYGGMHCAILMVNSLVVSAAIFRIFEEGVAEIPLVATKREFQGMGYFQSLFSCIVGLLTSLDVKSLVLPAAVGTESIWRDRFGFTKLDRQVQDFKIHNRIMIFEKTSILHKSITKI